jgi:hypothetical protein
MMLRALMAAGVGANKCRKVGQVSICVTIWAELH